MGFYYGAEESSTAERMWRGRDGREGGKDTRWREGWEGETGSKDEGCEGNY